MHQSTLSPKLIRNDGIYISLYVGTIKFEGVYFCHVFVLKSDGIFIEDYKPIDEKLNPIDSNSLNNHLIQWGNHSNFKFSSNNYKLIWTPTCLSIFEEDDYYPKEKQLCLKDSGDVFMKIFEISKSGSSFLTDYRTYNFLSYEEIQKPDLSNSVKRLFDQARPSKPSFLSRLGF